ncbi:MAG: permease, partial [Limnobacter sp.]|nr:permease [Limnobacter sp.]
MFIIFSTLGLWLREAGVDRSTVTFFSWAALGYSFKFIWAPLIDKLPVPLLSRLMGRRRSWLLLSQLGVAGSIMTMGLINPASSDTALVYMAFAAVALGFSSATQDICIDAFRIESAERKFQAILASMYVAGYRVGMLASGAGALWLASRLGTELGAYSYEAWRLTYFAMASLMTVGLLTTLIRPEPFQSQTKYEHSAREYLVFLGLFVLAVIVFVTLYTTLYSVGSVLGLEGFWVATVRLMLSLSGVAALMALIKKMGLANTRLIEDSYIGPVRQFLLSNGLRTAALLLAVVGLYRISDIVLGVISNLFYQDMGFTKDQIAFVVKTFGLGMTLLGGFLGGALTNRFGIFWILLWGAVLSAATNLLFMQFALMQPTEWMLYLVISADNLAGGVAVAAFVAYLSSLTHISFTAVQYAIFSSAMTLFPKVLGGYSGTMVDSFG